MAEEKVGPELPRESLNVNPPPGEPHAGVVVKIAGLYQFAGEVVHDGDRTFTGFAAGGARQGCFGVRVVLEQRKLIEVIGPDLGTKRKPVFPIAAPIHFLGELLDSGCGIATEGSLRAFGFEDQPVPNRWGETRHIGMAGKHMIPVTPVAAGGRNEGIELGERVLAGRCPDGGRGRKEFAIHVKEQRQFHGMQASRRTNGRRCHSPRQEGNQRRHPGGSCLRRPWHWQ